VLLNGEEWRDIEKIITFLEPFEELSQKIGGDKYPTLSFVVPAFNSLMDHLEDLMDPTLVTEDGVKSIHDCFNEVVPGSDSESESEGSDCESDSESVEARESLNSQRQSSATIAWPPGWGEFTSFSLYATHSSAVHLTQVVSKRRRTWHTPKLASIIILRDQLIQ
jgi:hypothetical protein